MSKSELQKAAAPAVPAEMQKAFGEFAGAGLETMRQEDKATPFLGVIQALSPQINKTEPKYIAGAEQGDIFDTITGTLYKVGARVIPVHFQKVYNTWVPRDQGGGFLGSYEDPTLTRPIFVTNRGAEYDGTPTVAPTANHYVLVEQADGGWLPALLSMTSTKLKVSRNWGTQMTIACERYNAPTWARIYKLTTVQEKNDKGTYFNFKVADDGFVTAEGFKAAVAFRKAILAGAVKVDYTKTEPEGTEAQQEEPAGKPSF